MSSGLLSLDWRSVSGVELLPQASLLGRECIDPRSRAGQPCLDDCHGFHSLHSLRFLIHGLDEPAFVAQLIEIFRASPERVLGHGFFCVGIHSELTVTDGVG